MNEYRDVVLFPGEVDTIEAAEAVNAAIRKAIPYLMPRGIEIAPQPNYITQTEVNKEGLVIEYALRYSGDIQDDLSMLLFDLGV